MDAVAISTTPSSSVCGDHRKQEVVYLHEWHDGFQAKRIIDNWIEFYNFASLRPSFYVVEENR
ncbi:hypothetical protein, partial [Yoonia sp.]|uniref:hypothetical protein n=1 Tax=Yoonia sp. TaxID=2212373 RepID=UPI0025F50D9B